MERGKSRQVIYRLQDASFPLRVIPYQQKCPPGNFHIQAGKGTKIGQTTGESVHGELQNAQTLSIASSSSLMRQTRCARSVNSTHQMIDLVLEDRAIIQTT